MKKLLLTTSNNIKSFCSHFSKHLQFMFYIIYFKNSNLKFQSQNFKNRNVIIKTLNCCKQLEGVLLSSTQSKRDMVGYINQDKIEQNFKNFLDAKLHITKPISTINLLLKYCIMNACC